MKQKAMDSDYVLKTTRSVRKRLDLEKPVSREIIEECLEIALQAPTGSNSQGWHFLIVTDDEPKKMIANAYRKAFSFYAKNIVPSQQAAMPKDDVRAEQREKVTDSAVYLAQVMERVPVLVIPCIEGRVEKEAPFVQAGLYGSILPAAWSFMLALRSRGLGAAWTTLHLMYEKEVAQALGIPDNITQSALLPVAYTIGEDFKPAKRLPLSQVTSWNRWEKT